MLRYPDAVRCHPAEPLLIRLAQRIRIEQRVWDDAVGGCLAGDLAEMRSRNRNRSPTGRLLAYTTPHA